MIYRNTKQRQAILDAIETHGGHLTAEEVYKIVKRRHPQLSLGTVYRNLRVLAQQDFVRELDFGMAITYFEIVKDTHYHLVCRICGSITDMGMELERKLMRVVERTSDAASDTGGFQIEQHRLDFVGICNPCQSKAAASSGAGKPKGISRPVRTPKAR